MADINAADRKQAASSGAAMPGGRFPIRNRQDLHDAIRAVGRAKGGEAGHRAVRRFIIKRAKALNASDMVPGSWRADGSLYTKASDMADDRAHGVKEGSPRDKALDAKRGVPSN